MIEQPPKGQLGAVDVTAEDTLRKALQAATKEGYRQLVVAMTIPGQPEVRIMTAGLTASERHRLLCIAAADALTHDLGIEIPADQEQD